MVNTDDNVYYVFSVTKNCSHTHDVEYYLCTCLDSKKRPEIIFVDSSSGKAFDSLKKIMGQYEQLFLASSLKLAGETVPCVKGYLSTSSTLKGLNLKLIE